MVAEGFFVRNPVSDAQYIRELVTKAEDEKRELTLVELGEIIRRARKMAGLYMGELADMLSTKASSLSGVELGKMPRPRRLP